MDQVLRSDSLFSDSDFFTGFASALNLGGNFYNFNFSENSDCDAMHKDWGLVGKDLKTAMNNMKKQGKESHPELID